MGPAPFPAQLTAGPVPEFSAAGRAASDSGTHDCSIEDTRNPPGMSPPADDVASCTCLDSATQEQLSKVRRELICDAFAGGQATGQPCGTADGSLQDASSPAGSALAPLIRNAEIGDDAVAEGADTVQLVIDGQRLAQLPASSDRISSEEAGRAGPLAARAGCDEAASGNAAAQAVLAAAQESATAASAPDSDSARDVSLRVAGYADAAAVHASDAGNSSSRSSGSVHNAAGGDSAASAVPLLASPSTSGNYEAVVAEPSASHDAAAASMLDSPATLRSLSSAGEESSLDSLGAVSDLPALAAEAAGASTEATGDSAAPGATSHASGWQDDQIEHIAPQGASDGSASAAKGAAMHSAASAATRAVTPADASAAKPIAASGPSSAGSHAAVATDAALLTAAAADSADGAALSKSGSVRSGSAGPPSEAPRPSMATGEHARQGSTVTSAAPSAHPEHASDEWHGSATAGERAPEAHLDAQASNASTPGISAVGPDSERSLSPIAAESSEDTPAQGHAELGSSCCAPKLAARFEASIGLTDARSSSADCSTAQREEFAAEMKSSGVDKSRARARDTAAASHSSARASSDSMEHQRSGTLRAATRSLLM